MKTSSSDAPAPEIVRHRVTAEQRPARVRTALPLRVIERPPSGVAPRVDVAPLARALADVFASVRAQVDGAFAAIERDCVELALAAAERVVRCRAERGELGLDEPLRALLELRRRDLEQVTATLRVN